jgi:hypothetical protein
MSAPRLARTLGAVVGVLLGVGIERPHAAETLGLAGEQAATTRGVVVDVACEIAGACPAECGRGAHPIGIRTEDGRLLLAAKSLPAFMGAGPDLLPWCGRPITVDGITVSNFGTTLFLLQRYRTSDDGAFRDADQALLDWASAHQAARDSEDAQNWMRHDEVVKTHIDKKGKTGVSE